MQQFQKWNGIGKAPFTWDNMLAQELINIPEMGLEGAVEHTAQTMLSYIDEETVKKFVQKTIEQLGITERNAEDAFRVLVEYWKVNDPGFDAYSNVVESHPGKVIFETGHDCQFCTKPVIALHNMEFYCNLRFKHDCFENPVNMILTKAVNPKLKWKLEYFRQDRQEPCKYSLVIEDETQNSESSLNN